MNKRIMAEKVAARLGMPYRDGYAALSAVLDVVEKELRAGHPVPLTGIGVLEPVKRAARQGHSPRTLEKVQIPARTVVRFRQSKALRGTMNQAGGGGS